MRLLLIFALTFTLSAQQDNKNNADEESTESGNEMMTKVLDALSEKHTMEIINALNKNDIEKLTECMEDECKMADFVDLMEKMLYFFKEVSHGDKPIYDLIKALVKHGPLAELVNELSEEHTLEIINALNAKEIDKLLNIGKRPINIFALISIGKKIVPIIKKANGGKGVSKLISIFTGGGDGNMENSNHMLEKIMNALSEEHTMKMVNALSTQEVEKLTDCLEGECSMADSVNLIEKMLNIFKGISHGDKLIYNLLKELFKHGPLAELVNELSEEYALEIINALNGKDINKLMNIGKDQVRKSEIISIGKKIIPIIKKAKGSKGVSILMSIFTDDEDEKNVLPYYQNVPVGLHPGMSVYMQGTVPERNNRTWVNFQVDFACGQHKEADVPLHFRPHINAETVGLSTLQAGRWGKEEKFLNPFRRGEQFEVILIVYDFGYQILGNRKVLCNYRHRIPSQNVRLIRIDGDLELQSLSVMGGPMMTLPYHHPVSDGLHPGMSVYMRGKVLRNCHKFRVDFACGKFEEADILFHFNPRFNQGTLVLNSYQSYRWAREERHKNPFQKNEHFEIIFIVNEAEYQILVNGNPLCKFGHRIPPQFLKFINLYGDLEFQSLTIVRGQIVGNMLLTGSAVYYPPVPYTGNIPGGLGPNKTITVRGFILKNATRVNSEDKEVKESGSKIPRVVFGTHCHQKKQGRFVIDLKAGQNIALHFNPRMKPWRNVVRNSCLNGRWGAEENELSFNPFQFGQYFEITSHCPMESPAIEKTFGSGKHLILMQAVDDVSISCDNHKFKVYNSGRHLFNFAHRYATIGHIRTFKIDGDVTLSYIKY